MKRSINLICMICAVALISLTGCKKEPGPKGDTGPAGPTGASGPQAKTYTFTATFNSTTTFGSYSGITNFDADDMVLVYLFEATYAGEDFYVQLPFLSSTGNVKHYAEVGENNGLIFVNAVFANGSSGGVYSTNTTLKYKAIHIKSSQVKAHPDVNYLDYQAVRKAFNIKD